MANKVHETEIIRTSVTAKEHEWAKLPEVSQQAEHKALEIEMLLLGVLIVDSRAIIRVITDLKECHFWDNRNKIIYSTIVEMFNNGESRSHETIRLKLKKTDNFQKAGGAVYLMDLMEKVTTSADLEYNCKILQEKYLERQMVAYNTELASLLQNPKQDVFELITMAQNGLISLMQDINRLKLKSVNEDKADFLAHLEKKDPVFMTGIKEVDTIAQMKASHFSIIGARPGMGKTVFLITAALAQPKTTKVLLFSLEMSKMELYARIYSNACEINGRNFRNGLQDYERNNIMNTNINNITIVDNVYTMEEIEMTARAFRIKNPNCELMIAVDYVQLITLSGKSGNRTNELEEISRRSKKLAKDTNSLMLSLAQLKREVETRADSKPKSTSDIGDYSFERDADLIMMLYRPEYYGIPADENGNSFYQGYTEGIIMKNRHDAAGLARFQMSPQFSKFHNYGVSFEEPKKDYFTKEHYHKNNPSDVIGDILEENPPF